MEKSDGSDLNSQYFGCGLLFAMGGEANIEGTTKKTIASGASMGPCRRGSGPIGTAGTPSDRAVPLFRSASGRQVVVVPRIRGDPPSAPVGTTCGGRVGQRAAGTAAEDLGAGVRAAKSRSWKHLAQDLLHVRGTIPASVSELLLCAVPIGAEGLKDRGRGEKSTPIGLPGERGPTGSVAGQETARSHRMRIRGEEDVRAERDTSHA